MDSPFSPENRQAAIKLMEAQSARKPEGLRLAQQDALRDLYNEYLEKTDPSDILLDLDAGALFVRRESEFEIQYAQVLFDDTIRKKVHGFRQWLPSSYRAHQLPLDSVGALAVTHQDAYVANAENSTDDYIAFSSGLTRLPLWGLVTGRLLDIPFAPRVKNHDDERIPSGDWSLCLTPLAMNIMGSAVEFQLISQLEDWYLRVDTSGPGFAVMACALEGFVILHELGHYELQHGDVYRQFSDSSEIPADRHHQMEHAADLFALKHLIPIIKTETHIGLYLAMLFALYSLHPSLSHAILDCADSKQHPHPFTRLVWLLRQLYPDDFRELRRDLAIAARIVMRALVAFGTVPDEDYADLTLQFALQKPDPPGTPNA